MTDPNMTEVAAHPLEPTPAVQPVLPRRACRPENCETRIHIGVFFDGTGNNRFEHEPLKKQSNVARLFRAYPDDRVAGYFPAYVPGIGTRFPGIGEEKPATFGSAFGEGGDGRINFGLLHVINSVHRAISPNNRRYVEDSIIKALCRNGARQRIHTRGGSHLSSLAEAGDAASLRAVGMEAKGGLLLDMAGRSRHRADFFRKASAAIAGKARRLKKPRLTEIFIDVFGFSRGAAQARTFCNWLGEICEGDMLCGAPMTIRFLGLFDTVASTGLPTSAGVGTDGHASWADAQLLRIPPAVRNCVHFVAMHENRGSFPSELVRVAGRLPANCHESMFPGMHSDVGGGYRPSEQGRGPNRLDEEKLSQLPLEAMYQAAAAARVPLDKALARDGSYDPFRIADNVRAAFTAFMARRQQPRRVRDWLVEYLAWRYQVRENYLQLPWAERAADPLHGDRQALDDLRGANRRLLDDVAAFAGLEALPPPALLEHPRSAMARKRAGHRSRIDALAPEARDVYAIVRGFAPTSDDATRLFADYCHDSYAGFRPFDQLTVFGWDPVPGSWEAEGYFRWRRRYEGDDVQLTRRAPASSEDLSLAA
jgi:hypothetical protein